ncbi:error-prone DNA polymerase [Microbacteriaceae bacterium SG_E_30_P1]|uniref:Error-prone DNA polymerase n=1 Tax=Antiquaquibacter oligotrophicus TaxID=2880260 RepID=A0ABT6KLJ8_9MICO|nr:error-prone DNA polymerase [Antiquaquibacter oligotrophicus]MDH6180888.1 error-prone DNA polymerase [Antiquaquibacter oligotrophicus]UDF14734.1 error-prone DNA polymerase [Antiquaquibacter oligotrophicus]
MGWNNPPVPWSEFERRLSDVSRPGSSPPPGADGGDSPAWSYKRKAYVPPADVGQPQSQAVPYAELHAHSSFSFLDGATMPELMAEEAARLGLHALALTDHDGLYGTVRMAEAAAELGLATIIGAELSLGLNAPQNGMADPEGDHLLVLARREEGYHRLSSAITAGHLAGGEKGRPSYRLEDLAREADGHWIVLTGCRKGAVRRALGMGIPDTRAAGRELDRLLHLFGERNVVVELFDHGDPLDDARNDALAQLASDRGLRIVATTNAHYATPENHHLHAALAAVRARRSLDELDGWLPAAGQAYLRSGAEMAEKFARYPGAIENTVTIADELAFELRRTKPALPDQKVPPGHTPASYLRELVWAGAARRGMQLSESIGARIHHELDIIEEKGFPGYFLIVWDIVREARSRGILCQGRGSAAASVVCYLLDITAVDPIRYKLPFERFISTMREEEPDIDVDFESDRREEIIQYVFEKYGRRNAAQVCNVIQYRPKAAVRDMAKALGYSPGQQDAWSKQVERWTPLPDQVQQDHDIPDQVIGLALEAMKFPRHLGIHSGGMVLTQRPVGEVVPIEHARKEKRTVLQWDKDDCAWMGLVKFDLLGLGMLSALRYCFDIVEETLGEKLDLDTLPKEEQGVYDQLCRADAIGVFQVESRAQLGLLPRLQPREFYHLVVEIALVRPGPIQGGAVHPYVRRKMGQEPVSYVHPNLLEPLERTLGVPIFQEQLMQIAVAVGGCTPDDADLLRRAMGSKRGVEKIEKLRDKLYAGMKENGITGEAADQIYGGIQAFAGFGFAESHALSFGLLVYASAWLRLHYPGAFLAALLRAQPMGFYSPQSLVADARRHGVEVLRPDIQRSRAGAALEATDSAFLGSTGDPHCLDREQPPVGPFDRSAPFDTNDHRRDGAYAVRLGLDEVSGISDKVAEAIVGERDAHGEFRDMNDLVRRTGLLTAQLEALAAAGAFECFGHTTREAMWNAGNAAQDRPEFLAGSIVAVQPPLFTMPTDVERLMDDLWATGVSTDSHPVAHLRSVLREQGILSADDLTTAESGRRVRVAGVVTHRQRPATASGITFVNLEDETGFVNVICSVGLWGRFRRVVREAPALVIRGMLERSPDGVINVVADHVEQLSMAPQTRSRDFR